MGLAEIVRAAVAVADRVTKGLQVDVTHTATASVTGDGEVIAGAVVVRQALVERRQQLMRLRDGRMVTVDQRVFFVGNVAVQLTDTLVDDEGKTGPLLFVGGFRDPAGGTYYTEVWCGGRGSQNYGG